MIQRIYSLFFVFLFVVFSSSAFAASSTDAASDEKEFNAVEMIMHHIGDANEWHLFTLNEGTPDEKHVSIPLPVIVKDPSGRSEEHTSELQSRENLVCRLLLE